MLKLEPTLDHRKKKIKTYLENYIKINCPKRNIAIMLSGGADSMVLALAAHNLGKKITAFSFQVKNYPNEDFIIAKHACDVMGWDFVPVSIDTKNLSKRFQELFTIHGCKKKTEAECLFPMIDTIKHVKNKGYNEILSGFGSVIPDDRKSAILCSKDTKAYWNSCLESEYSGDSSATIKIVQVAKNNDLKILMPLCQKEIISILSGLTTKEMMGAPYPKHHYKDLYFKNFQNLGLLKRKNCNLQVGGQIEKIFIPLLSEPQWSKKYNKGNEKGRLSSLCQFLGKQAENNTTIMTNCSYPTETMKEKFKPYFLSDVDLSSKKQLFNVVSTFAGAGGSSTGYRLAGGNIIFANEFVEAAINTYRLNYPDTPIVIHDIRKLNRGKEKVEQLFKSYGIDKGQLDIFDGSPPCATFSTASAGRGKDKMDKKNVAYSDTTQSRIGYLIHDYVFMANVIQPKICIMENVPGIVRSHVFNEALDRLRRYGYIISYKKLLATNYGAPQKRERLFVLALRPDIAKEVGIKDENDLAKVFPQPTSDIITTRQALADIKINPEERDMLLTLARKSASYEIISKLPLNPPKNTGISDIIHDWKSDFSLTRISWDLPAPTITATGAAGRGGLIHPDENRPLGIMELKRLMSLPDDFKLTGTFAQKAERIGRMVPPLLTKAIAESVHLNILKKIKVK